MSVCEGTNAVGLAALLEAGNPKKEFSSLNLGGPLSPSVSEPASVNIKLAITIVVELNPRVVE